MVRRLLACLHATGAALLIAAAVACASGAPAAIGTAKGFNVARVAPADRRPPVSFEAPVLAVREGERLDQGYLRGVVSVVNFWGSWCGPCRAEQPLLSDIYRSYRERGVRFLGVDLRDSRGNGIAYREEFRVPYPSLYSPDAAVAYAFGVAVTPTTLVLDRRGRVAARITGALRARADLTGVLDEALGEPA